MQVEAVNQITKIHETQPVNYLLSTVMDIGLLINSGPEKVQQKRIECVLKDIKNSLVNPVILFKKNSSRNYKIY
jgi:hypothetical protein